MLKRFFGTLTFLALFVSLSADPISPQKARQLAGELLPPSSTQPLKLRRHAPAQEKNAQEPVYIFSRGANKGYVIMSGDDCLPAILGYTEEGDFDEQTLHRRCAPGCRTTRQW